MPALRHDIIILGGGLAGGLSALSLARERPDLEVLLIEPAAKIGGNHLWSFFGSDIAGQNEGLVEPLVGHRWPSYDVSFPAHVRHIRQPYYTIASERLDEAVRGTMHPDRILRTAAVAVTPDEVELEGGSRLSATAVLDTRGLSGSAATNCGWQKFVGQLLHIAGGHQVNRPIVMDATVDQSDGYRFVYCLPFSPTDIFVEDTYYSETPDLDRSMLSDRIAAYARSRGWEVEKVEREETGVLPVVTGGDFDDFWPAEDMVARGGVRGGFFHPLTSYSLPDAVRFASWLGRQAPLDARLGPATRRRAASHWAQGRFDRMLARMLFRAADPAERYKVLERFYRLPTSLIERFYAGQSTAWDRVRILAGKPPVPINRAVRAMLEDK